MKILPAFPLTSFVDRQQEGAQGRQEEVAVLANLRAAPSLSSAPPVSLPPWRPQIGSHPHHSRSVSSYSTLVLFKAYTGKILQDSFSSKCKRFNSSSHWLWQMFLYFSKVLAGLSNSSLGSGAELGMEPSHSQRRYRHPKQLFNCCPKHLPPPELAF